MSRVKALIRVLSTGYIFVYFSEHLFWARVRPDDSLLGWIGAWGVYSFLALIFLLLVSHFRVKNRWALFLAGAAFGWLAEGLIVQTTYEMLPLSLSFTGLAWHGLITVWIGWYALRQALRSANAGSVVGLASLIGLGYGLWALSWWLEPDGGVSSVAEFAAFSFITTSLVILAYWLADWSEAGPQRLNRWSGLAVAAVLALYFTLVTAPHAPLAILILPVLLGCVVLGLNWNRRAEGEGSLLAGLAGRSAAWRYLSLYALPVTAVGVYALAAAWNVQWHTNWVLYLVTTPLGFILFGVSLYKLGRREMLRRG